jgi:NAD(P)-dependent dehydrogenase (short-subunit alcohol dehydrogenase family)
MTTVVRTLRRGAFLVGLLAAATFVRRNRLAVTLLFTRKVVFITGSSRGLGLALAAEFLRRGARVVISARNPEELARACGQLQSMTSLPDGADIMQVVCDVTEPSSVQDALNLVHNTFGPIDVLVNNAGIMAVAPVLNQSLERFKETMNTNFYGALYCSLGVLNTMLARGEGTIINIASIGGLISVPHMLPYTASKFALVGFSRGLHAELKSKGLNVLTVCPWLMRTGSHLHASIGGKQNLEYGWFGAGATLPLLSVPAQEAAREIVRAASTGKSELLISRWAVIASKIGANVPGLTAAALSLMNRILPEEELDAGDSQIEGRDVRGSAALLPNVLGRSAELTWNE